MRTLVDDLNALIQALGLASKDIICSPTDLTPGLLIDILASLLPSLSYVPLPVDDDVQAMKVFLGVLETDVLRSGDSDCDISVCYVDPRRLAKGGRDECEYVGKVLVWLGRQLGLDLPDEDDDAHEEEDILAGLDGTLKSEQSIRDDEQSLCACIHDLSFSSHASSSEKGYHCGTSIDDSFSPSKSPTIRYNGWIGFADEAREIEEYELRQSRGSEGRSPILTASGSTSGDYVDRVAYFTPNPTFEDRPITPPSPSPTRPTASSGLARSHKSSAYLYGETFDILRTPRKPTRRDMLSPPLSPTDFSDDQGNRHAFSSRDTSRLTLDEQHQGSYARTLALLNRRATLLEEIARHKRRRSDT